MESLVVLPRLGDCVSRQMLEPMAIMQALPLTPLLVLLLLLLLVYKDSISYLFFVNVPDKKTIASSTVLLVDHPARPPAFLPASVYMFHFSFV